MAMSRPPIRNPAGSGNAPEPRNGSSGGISLCADTVSVGCRLAKKSRCLSFSELHRISDGKLYYPKSKIVEIIDCADASHHIRSLIEAALVRADRSAPLTEKEVRDFLYMDPGIRELRMRNFVAAGWDEADWRGAVQGRRDALEEIRSMCSISALDRKNLFDALMANPQELSLVQRDIVCQVVGKARGVAISDVTRSELIAFIEEFHNSLDRGRHLWRTNQVGFMTLSDLVHTVRFSDQPLFSDEHEALFQSMLRKIKHQNLTLWNGSDFMKIKEMFDQSCYEDHQCHFYQPLIYSAWLLNQDLDMRPENMLNDARRESEFHTMMVFLGATPWKSVGTLVSGGVSSEPALYRAADNSVNEDNSSSANIFHPDKTMTSMDAVFDGVGGYVSGEIASGMARDIFDIYALAGWFNGPEDMRRMLISADLAIMMRQLSTSNDISKASYAPGMKMIRTSQSSMGTTAVLSMQKGSEVYFANAGDSAGKVVAPAEDGRSSRIIFATIPHSRHVGLSLIGTRDQKLAELLSGNDLSKITTREYLSNLAEAERMAEAEAVQLNNMGLITNVVSSYLGGSANFIQINNSTRSFSPIVLPPGGRAMLIMGTDGLWDVTCDEDIMREVHASDYDPDAARLGLVKIARSRSIGKLGHGPFTDAASLEIYLQSSYLQFDPAERSRLLSISDGLPRSFHTIIGDEVIAKNDNGTISLTESRTYQLPDGKRRDGKDDDLTLKTRNLVNGP